ncbi:MAG: N-carbamoylputrescine amidase [Deltaproteobacteria bacterium]|nr:N-carbamoylputrescine amidase [Deltaproteobacteria bacterium]
MSQEVTVAAIQCPLGGSREDNVARITAHVREAAGRGANVILPPELFEGPYFCREEKELFFEWARPFEGNETIAHFATLAKELKVVLPISFFEKAGPAYYNSLAMIDETGRVLGLYRKSHIPDGPGYEEKYYFRPGDTGFRVWKTGFGAIGVGICWDQWYPECARAMVLGGAEILLYPTAIGAEPNGVDTKDPWQRAMIGHAVSNATPVIAANRIGLESWQDFYGCSFCADMRGDKLAELQRGEEGVCLATYDRQKIHEYRASWGFFRDRRPELYGALTTADGQHVVRDAR